MTAAQGKTMPNQQSIEAATILRRKPGLVAADTADEAILLDIDTGYFYQLNKTGAKIWTLVEEPMAFGALCEAMASAFRVDPETCRSDVQEFVADLLDRGILEIEG